MPTPCGGKNSGGESDRRNPRDFSGDHAIVCSAHRSIREQVVHSGAPTAAGMKTSRRNIVCSTILIQFEKTRKVLAAGIDHRANTQD
ncbi:hypothetical protein PGT21_005008 [Puccinia graminis f. sp. tritici]|uniref:Uncharacterized protein n=1 Tax=Puccinia graminis f. sp. tritici TaxID=56615 RepID=A0A5B0N3H9_PUCGR|nr:hypothetical protein PGT21_005008 [Puccinia graminis f. sp. tritici]